MPVLLDHAGRLDPDSLPAELASCARAQYRRMRHRHARDDIARLVSDVRELDTKLVTVEEAEGDPVREERRRIRRRRRLRLKAARLGRSRGGQTSKIHVAGDRKCRPLAFVLTAGQAADSPQFIPVLGKVRVRMPVGRPRTRPGAVAGDKA
ncbi:hypothetical protein EBF04_23250 [Streptomyces sp. I6]|nr:hypothetical protein EBF04_23250 [Streptomyces sp. I6]